MKLIATTIVGAAMVCLPAMAAHKGKQDQAVDIHNDAAFLTMAAQADMTTAHIGEEAEDRAATAQVKDFAKTMVQDHKNDYTQLSELAGKLGETIPKSIDTRDVHTIMALDHYKGKTYDHMVLMREAEEHEKLVRAYKAEAQSGQDPRIKAYANQTLPVIEKHLHEAQDLLKSKA